MLKMKESHLMLFCVGVDSGQLCCCWSSGTGNLLILQCSDTLTFKVGILDFCKVVQDQGFVKCSLKQVKQRLSKDMHRKTNVPNFMQSVEN